MRCAAKVLSVTHLDNLLARSCGILLALLFLCLPLRRVEVSCTKDVRITGDKRGEETLPLATIVQGRVCFFDFPGGREDVWLCESVSLVFPLCPVAVCTAPGVKGQ